MTKVLVADERLTESRLEVSGWLKAGSLALLVFIVYWPAVHGQFLWDDDDYVVDNAGLRSAAGLGKMWASPRATPQYYPLAFTSLWLDYQLWGLNPTGYHLVNIALHALNVIGLWWVLAKLRVPGAWLGAALFAVHPVEVESVAWITERKNVLSGFFYLAALAAYLQFDPLDSAPRPRRRAAWYALALVLFVASLLSKTVTCSFPAVIVLLIWWKRGRVRAGDWLALAPFFVLGLSLALFTAWVEKHITGASGPQASMPMAARVLIAGQALWFYAAKIVWPLHLSFVYPRWDINPEARWQFIYPAAALGVLSALWLGRRRLGRGPLVAALIFAGTLTPALGFFDVWYMIHYSYVADHFQYLASAALLALAAAGFVWLGDLKVPLAGAALLALSILTWTRAGVFRDQPTLWKDTFRENPDCWMGYNNLGKYYVEQGDGAMATLSFQQALQHHHPDPWEIYYNLGLARLLMKDRHGAEQCFRQVLEQKPDYVAAHNQLGTMYWQEGRQEQQSTGVPANPRLQAAKDEFCAAIASDASYWLAHFNLGAMLLDLRRTADARAELDRVIELEPNYAPAYYKLGQLQLQEGQVEDAVRSLQHAVDLDPADSTFQEALARARHQSQSH
jgi:tetratricopeptide (TPR) repeat protein